MTIYDRELIINTIINSCEQLRQEYKHSGISPLARAWEKDLTNFAISALSQIEASVQQERRIVDILSPRYPNDLIEEIEYHVSSKRTNKESR